MTVKSKIDFKLKSVDNIKEVLEKYLIYGIKVVTDKGVNVSANYVDTLHSTEDDYYIEIPKIDVEDYGYYIINDYNNVSVEEIEAYVNELGYDNLSEAMFYGYESLFYGFEGDEFKYEVWLKLQNKTYINIFWTHGE